MTTRKRNKRWVYVYLNDEAEYADAAYTAWPFNRVLRHFKNKFTDWHTIEVRCGSIESDLGVVSSREQHKP